MCSFRSSVYNVQYIAVLIYMQSHYEKLEIENLFLNRHFNYFQKEMYVIMVTINYRKKYFLSSFKFSQLSDCICN